MEQEQLPEVTEGQEQKINGCAGCGSSYVLPDYPTPLCQDCREKFIKYPIPMGVKIFSGIVAALVVFALFTFPKNLSVGLHLERGKKAEKERRYITAEKEFTEVTKALPKNKEALGHLLIASFYNENLGGVIATSDKLNGVEFDENDKLLQRMNDIMHRTSGYIPDDSLLAAMKPYLDKDEKVPDSIYTSYLQTHPRDIYTLRICSGFQFDAKNYNASDSMVSLILEQDDEYIPGWLMRAGVKREQGKWDEAIASCNEILKLNREAGFAYAAMARTYLKQKKDKEALDIAAKAYNMDTRDAYSAATLVLAYHFNNDVKKRDELLKNSEALRDSSNKMYTQYAIDVINQKEIFRN